MTPLKRAIREALAGSSGQKPVPVETLYALGPDREAVEAALLELYRAQEIGCCLHSKAGVQRSVWWESGGGGKQWTITTRRHKGGA